MIELRQYSSQNVVAAETILRSVNLTFMKDNEATEIFLNSEIVQM